MGPGEGREEARGLVCDRAHPLSQASPRQGPAGPNKPHQPSQWTHSYKYFVLKAREFRVSNSVQGNRHPLSSLTGPHSPPNWSTPTLGSLLFSKVPAASCLQSSSLGIKCFPHFYSVSVFSLSNQCLAEAAPDRHQPSEPWVNASLAGQGEGRKKVCRKQMTGWTCSSIKRNARFIKLKKTRPDQESGARGSTH